MSKELKYRILLVDDETDILEFVSYNLRKEGYEVSTATNGKDAIEEVKKMNPHLIILDIMMPEMDGIETCEKIRSSNLENQPLIAFLTARGENYSQVVGFEAGADDYIIKPINPKVLISRIKALLKRYSGEFNSSAVNKEKEDMPSDNIVIDKERFVVINKGKELLLTKKEFDLLSLLASHPEKVYKREEIFQQLWGDDIIVSDRNIDVHVRRLREKIGEEHIVTLKGVGYKYIE
ncbi:MAG: response regulator transcription factor [Bacteroidota bacterium]|nr:response regulator transcription factor [Bacteroidota bacterium]